MKRKKLFILTGLFTFMALAACSGGDFKSIIRKDPGDDGSVHTEYREYDNGKRIEQIIVDVENVKLNLSDTTQHQIVASYLPSDAYDAHIYYESLEPEIAEVDETGLVTMLDNGTANIKVFCDYEANTTVTILGYTPVTGIDILPHIESETGYVIDIKEERDFSIHTTPETASEREVTWEVLDSTGAKSNIASIDEKGHLTISPDAKGAHNIPNFVKATSVAHPEITAIEKITINDDRSYAETIKIKNGEMDVTGTTIDLLLNESLGLTAETNPTSTSGEKLKWTSSDANVVEIDELGIMTAKRAPATAVITASIDGVESKVTVNTSKVDVQSVTLDTHELILNKGVSQKLSCTVEPSDASVKEVKYEVIDGHQYVTVDDDGTVHALSSTLSEGDYKAVTIKVTSLDNNEIYDLCSVKVTNKISKITINEPADKLVYGGNKYQMNITAEPVDADPYNVTWSITSGEELATINPVTGELTTNNGQLIGPITVEAKVNGSEILDTIDLRITKAPENFKEGIQYLVGNRDFTNPVFDYDNPSWDDAALALQFEEGHSSDPRFEAEYQLLGVNFEPYDVSTQLGDLFKMRSVEWPKNLGLNDYEKNKAVFAGDDSGNLTVAMRDQYNIYYQKLNASMEFDTGYDYWVYMESSFTGNYYIVGNREFNSGTSKGEAGIDTSWNYVPTAMKLVRDQDTTYGEQYIGTISMQEGDEFRIRNENWFDVALGEEYSFVSINAEGNFVINAASTYTFYFKPSMEGNKLYIVDIGKPVEPTGLSFTEGTTFSLAEGRSASLTPVITPNEATFRNVIYSSDNPDVISVDANGTLTAKAAVGTAKITAYIEGYPSVKAEIIVSAKANEFTWGIAHSSSWTLDPTMDFVEISVPDGSDAMYAYQATAKLDKDVEWKVANTNNEWVNNVEGSVGIDLVKSTEGAFYITEGGNIKTLISDTYTVTLLIWDGAEKDAGGNFTNGVSIIAKGSGQPGPTPTTPKYHYVLNDVAGKDLVVGKDPDGNPQLEALNIEMKAGDKLYFENYAPETPERLTSLQLGEDDGTKGCGFTIDEGVLTASKAGKFSFFVKLAYGHDEVYIAQGDQPEPEPFAWGVAGNFSSWKMDNEHKFEEVSPEGTALYTYKLVNYEFTAGDEWKVLNNNVPAEWVNNVEGTVGFDFVASTYGAFELSNGNIKVKTAGYYNITLNIFEGALKDGDNFVSGVQIIAVKQDSPVPTTTYSYKVNGGDVAPMTKGSGDTWTCEVNDMKANDTISFLSVTSDVPTDITKLTLVAGDTGFTESNGVLTASKAGNFTFTLTVNNGAITVTVRETSPVPVIPDYVLHGKFDGSTSWTDKQMSKKDDTEYQLLGVELSEGDVFSIHLAEGCEKEWLHYFDLKDSAKALNLVESDGSADDNIKVLADGTYDIYVKLNYDEGDHGYVYIAKSPIHKMHGSLNGGEWADYDMVKNLDPEKPTEWTYTGDFAVGDLLGFKFPNDAWYGFDNIKDKSPAVVAKDGENNNIKITVAGNYTFYVDEVADPDTDNHIWIVKNDQPVSTDKYGLMINDTFDQFGTDGDSSYTIDKTFAINDVIKVAKTNGKGELTYLDIIFTKITFDESKFTFDSKNSKLTVKTAGKYTINIALAGGEVNTMVVKDYKEPVVLEGYYVSVNGVPTYSLHENKDVANEYLCDVAHFIANDKLTIYDATNDKTFHAKLDQYSLPHFTDGKDAITCDRDGYYSLCLKLIPDNDELYIGEPKVEYTGFYASTQEHRYDLVPATADADHKANYSVSLAENPLTAGTRVNFYGKFMYEGDEVSNLIDYKIAPNPDDTGNKIQNNLKPATKGGVDFTVLKNTDGTLYFNINKDDSFGFWLTGGPEILEGYWLQVNGQNVAKVNYDKKEGDFDQYKTTYQTSVGDVITFYDADNDKNISVTLDAASTGFSQSKGITCTTAGNYDFYLKLKYSEDQVYIGPHIEQNAFDVKFTLPDWGASVLTDLKIHYWPEGEEAKDAYATMNGKEGTSHIEVKKDVTKLNMCVCFKENGTEKWSTNVSINPEDKATYQITSSWVWKDGNFEISINKI